MNVKTYADNEFAGVNNKANQLSLRSNIPIAAMNVDLTDAKAIVSRKGFEQRSALSSIRSAFITKDQRAMYVVAGNTMYRVFDDFSMVSIKTDVPAGKIFWSESGNRIGVSGAACGVIRQESNLFVEYPLDRPAQPNISKETGGLPAGEYSVLVTEIVNGEETPATRPVATPVADGAGLRVSVTLSDMATAARIYCTSCNGSVYYLQDTITGSEDVVISSAPTDGERMEAGVMMATGLPGHDRQNAFFQSSWMVGLYDINSDTSYVYKSEPFKYGLFDLVNDYIAIPGKLNLMQAAGSELILGSTKGVLQYDGQNLRTLSNVSVPEHSSVAFDKTGVMWFWTNDGLARFPDFKIVTDSTYEPVACDEVSVGLVEDKQGDKVVVTTRT